MRTIKRDIAGAVVLVGQNVKGGVYDNPWVIPGGGMDEGETKQEATRRELLEEVGIDINDGTILVTPNGYQLPTYRKSRTHHRLKSF